MKKLFLAIMVVSVVVSCKKISQGGNLGRLKLEEGVERYSDDAIEGAAHGESHEGAEHAAKEPAEVVVELEGIQLKAHKGGLEESMVSFLKSGGYENANDDALKGTWYNFDQVNFKLGSSNQLEAGSEQQLDNLAKILEKYPQAKIKIGGYTDKTGEEASNIKLSQARATFIKAELGKKGVVAQVISAEGYGSSFATVAKEASDEKRAIDRKMAVRFTK